MRTRTGFVSLMLLSLTAPLFSASKVYAPLQGGVIERVNPTNGKEAIIAAQSSNAFEFVLSPDGSTFFVLFVNDWNRVQAIDAVTGAVKQNYYTTYQRWDNFLGTIPFYVSADGSRFVLGTCADNVEGTCQAGYAEVFDVASGEEIGMISMGGDEVSGVALSSDGSTGYASHFFNFVCVGCDGKRSSIPGSSIPGSSIPSDAITEFSVPSMTAVKSLAIEPPPGEIVLNAAGTVAYTAGGAIRAISLPDLTVTHQISVSPGTNAIALSANQAMLATTQSFYNQVQFNDFVDFFNASDLSAIGTVTLPPDTTNGHIAIDPSGEFAYVGPGPYQISSQTLSIAQTYNVGDAFDVGLGLEGMRLYPLASAGNNVAEFAEPAAEPLKAFTLSAGAQALAVSTGGEFLYEADSDGIGVIAISTGEAVNHFLSYTSVTTLASSPNGKTLYAGDNFGNIYEIFAVTGRVKEIIPETQIAPASVCLSPDGTKLVISSPIVAIYNTTDGSMTNISIAGLSSTVGPCAIDPTGRFAYITYGLAPSGSNVAIADLSTHTQTGNLTFGGGPIVFSPTSPVAFIANGTALDVVNTSSSTVTSTIPIGLTPTGAAITPDGDFLYITGTPNGAVVNTSTMKIRAPLYAGGPIVAQ